VCRRGFLLALGSGDELVAHTGHPGGRAHVVLGCRRGRGFTESPVCPWASCRPRRQTSARSAADPGLTHPRALHTRGEPGWGPGPSAPCPAGAPCGACGWCTAARRAPTGGKRGCRARRAPPGGKRGCRARRVHPRPEAGYSTRSILSRRVPFGVSTETVVPAG
jgi:hypothetical protein